MPVGTIVAVATFVAYSVARDRLSPFVDRHPGRPPRSCSSRLGWTSSRSSPRPLTPAAIALVVAMTASVGLLFALPVTRRFYALGLPPSRALIAAAVIAAAACAVLEGWWVIDQRGRPPTSARRASRLDGRSTRWRGHRSSRSELTVRGRRTVQGIVVGAGRPRRSRRRAVAGSSRRGGGALRLRADEDDVGEHRVVPREAFVDVPASWLLDDAEEPDVVAGVTESRSSVSSGFKRAQSLFASTFGSFGGQRTTLGGERRRLDDVDAPARRRGRGAVRALLLDDLAFSVAVQADRDRVIRVRPRTRTPCTELFLNFRSSTG